MTLSEPLKLEIETSLKHLRNALAFAAATERPNVLTSLSKVINEIDLIQRHDELMDGLDEAIKECEIKRLMEDNN